MALKPTTRQLLKNRTSKFVDPVTRKSLARSAKGLRKTFDKKLVRKLYASSPKKVLLKGS